MTQQFDEGVKEILMTLLSLGATMYETNYVIDQLKKRPEPIEQKIQAIDKAEQIVKKPVLVKSLQRAKQEIKKDTITKKPQEIQRPVKKSSKEQYIFDKLTKGGLTPNAAIGVIANIKVEAPTLDPSIKQYGGGPGRGLVQWEKGGRFDTDRINLVSFAKKRGKDWTDFDTQIDFILHELNTHPEFMRVKKMLNDTKNPKEATLIFLKKYEKAGEPHEERRTKHAEELMKELY